jgi:hypothetical protein
MSIAAIEYFDVVYTRDKYIPPKTISVSLEEVSPSPIKETLLLSQTILRDALEIFFSPLQQTTELPMRSMCISHVLRNDSGAISWHFIDGHVFSIQDTHKIQQIGLYGNIVNILCNYSNYTSNTLLRYKANAQTANIITENSLSETKQGELFFENDITSLLIDQFSFNGITGVHKITSTYGAQTDILLQTTVDAFISNTDVLLQEFDKAHNGVTSTILFTQNYASAPIKGTEQLLSSILEKNIAIGVCVLLSAVTDENNLIDIPVGSEHVLGTIIPAVGDSPPYVVILPTEEQSELSTDGRITIS